MDNDTGVGGRDDYLDEAVRPPSKAERLTVDTAHREPFQTVLEQAGHDLVRADFVSVETLIGLLMARSASRTELAAVYRLKIDLHLRRSESPDAVATALECLQMLGISIPLHPTQSELETVFIDVWQRLDACPVETIAELPLVTDQEVGTIMEVLAALYEPALFTDERLVGVHLCHMVRLTLEHGITEASVHALGLFGFTIGHYFGRYEEGYRFCEVAREIVRRHGFSAYEAKSLYSLEMVSIWTKPISFAIEASQASFDAALKHGDVPYACYARIHTITDMLARGDHLASISQEIDDAMTFVSKTNFLMVMDVLVSQRRFVDAMVLGPGESGIFNGQEFVESDFEGGFTPAGSPTSVCWYWLIRAQACYLYGDFVGASHSLEQARPLIWSSLGHIQMVDFHVLSALILAASLPDEAADREERIVEHGEWLARWSESSPTTFSSKHCLVLAELARIQDRPQDAERLYDKAIRAAFENAIVQDEGLANEVAARFYLERGAERTAQAYLTAARDSFSRWGAQAKAGRVDAICAEIGQNDTGATGRLGKETDHELERFISLSLPLSDEIDLDRVVSRLLTTALEETGSTRGYLVTVQPADLVIEAEATRGHVDCVVMSRKVSSVEGELPETLIRETARTLETFEGEQASLPKGLANDPYFAESKAGSILCLPLVKKHRLIGILYLESHGLSKPACGEGSRMLRLLATQAALSLENARLFADVKVSERRLEESEREFRTANDSMPTLTWSSDANGKSEVFNKQWHDYTGLTPEQARNGGWKYVFHPDDRAASAATWHRIVTKREVGEVEARLRRHDGEYRWFIARARPICDATGKIIRCYGTESDIDDLKRAEALLAGEKRLFEMIATGQPLKTILDALCKAIGELSGEALISILLLDEDGQTLRSGGGYNLPEGFADAFDRVMTGPQSGSCGTAAFRREAVLVNDITSDPLWADYRDLALRYDLRACWSTPIMSTSSAVLGTIAIYSKEKRPISQRERQVIDQFTHLASIVIERKNAEEALRQSEALLVEGQRISHTGSWAWNLATGRLRCSAEQRRIFGFRPDEEELSYGDFVRRIHVEDRKRTVREMADAARQGRSFEQTFRIVLSNAETRHIHGSGRPVLDDADRLGGYFGAVTDITVQKLAGAKLEAALTRAKQSEEQQRTLIDMIPCHAWTSDPKMGGEFFSRQWLDYAGVTLEQAKGTKWRSIIHPDDVARHVELFAKARDEKTVGKVESRLRRHDGSYRWFLFTAQPLVDRNGEIVKWYGTNIDIDDLKRAEMLIEAEKRLFKMIATGEPLGRTLDTLCRTVEALADGALASILLLDEDGVRLRHAASPSLPETYTNPIDGGIIGPAEGSCGTAVYRAERVFSPDIDSDPLWAKFKHLALDHGLRACTSTPILSSEGRVFGAFAIYSRTMGTISENTIRLVDQFTDLASIVVERRRADEALRKSEAFLSEGQKISHTGSWAWDQATDKLVWSDEHCRIFGYRLQDVGGRFQDMLARMLPEERLAFEQAIDGPRSKNEDFQVEFQATLPNGLVKQLLCTGRASLNAGGDLVEYVGTTMDITERKRVEKELQRSAAHLREVQAELAHVARATTMGELAASIAHEVNQPLTGIIASGGAALRWLSKGTPDVAKAKESLQNVIGDGRRASEVITRIRKMFRKELATREPLLIKDVIDDVVILTRGELQKNDIVLRLEAPGVMPLIPGDRVQLQQVLVNVILNAIDALKEVQDHPRILSISTSNDGTHVRVDVADTGPGVTPDCAEKIFRPFFTSKTGGMGMGLSICRSIIESHGGRMKLLAATEPGCRIQFTLPIDDWIGQSCDGAGSGKTETV